MPHLHIIAVGKLKDPHIIALENEYLKRIHLFKVHIHELKTCPDSIAQEGENILKKIHELNLHGQGKVFLLHERGDEFTSHQFSKKIMGEFLKCDSIVLVIGGAMGHSELLLQQARWGKISLSQLTFPHQMVRTLIMEQLYRAQTIYLGHPYHH